MEIIQIFVQIDIDHILIKRKSFELTVIDHPDPERMGFTLVSLVAQLCYPTNTALCLGLLGGILESSPP